MERGNLQKLKTRVILEVAEANPCGEPVKKGTGKGQIIKCPAGQPEECFDLLLYDYENSTPRNSLCLHEFGPEDVSDASCLELHFSWSPAPSVLPEVLAAYNHHVLLIILLSSPVSDAAFPKTLIPHHSTYFVI